MKRDFENIKQILEGRGGKFANPYETLDGTLDSNLKDLGAEGDIPKLKERILSAMHHANAVPTLNDARVTAKLVAIATKKVGVLSDMQINKVVQFVLDEKQPKWFLGKRL